MDRKTLLDALTAVWTTVPDDPHFHVPVAEINVTPTSIADDLWYDLVIRNSRVNILPEIFMPNDVPSLKHVNSSSGTASPASGVTWDCAAFRFTKSDAVFTTISYWATNILEDLLVPIKRAGAIPTSARLCSSSSQPTSSRVSHVGPRILARGGVISPIGHAIDFSAPRDIQQMNPTKVAHLQAAHIIPFKVSRYDYTHLLFDEFAIGIGNVNGRYLLRKLDLGGAAVGFIRDSADGGEIVFGTGPQGNHIALPDGELLNVQLAIGRVLHASGACELISRILKDEDDYNEGIVKDASSAARISAFALKLKLKRLQDKILRLANFSSAARRSLESLQARKLVASAAVTL
ncbi:hypothetical protein V1525DRAFT_457436 [Lipomyces kononenkoae]|uniref:Uncharacterized protein n=1 Tax=Lipomyces kononenkoae TaxID=34357 RepID=A0ACC3T0Z8_LIPKO